MSYTIQFQAEDTIATGSSLLTGATSCILTSGNFGTPTGTQLYVIDYNIPGSAEIVSATVAGTAMTSITRGLSGGAAGTTNHTGLAKVGAFFVPQHYANGLGAIASGDAWTVHSSTIVGFSGTPTQSNHYFILGKILFYKFDITGTSNSTALTFTIPSAAKESTRYGGYFVTDSSTDQTVAGAVATAASGTTISTFKDMTGTAWTNTGSKAIRGMLICELA